MTLPWPEEAKRFGHMLPVAAASPFSARSRANFSPRSLIRCGVLSSFFDEPARCQEFFKNVITPLPVSYTQIIGRRGIEGAVRYYKTIPMIGPIRFGGIVLWAFGAAIGIS